nr:peptidylprolyl isomerase [Psychrobacter sp. PraFG1]UNK04845.1 peptidylprolyl isomerase [Psychrobacter sp. PraFG1]
MNTDDAQSVLDELSAGIAKNYVAPVQGGDMGYHEASGLPTDIAKQITPLNVGQVTEPQITPEGIDVVKLVDKRNNDNMIIPQWKVRHILIKTDEQNSDALAEQKSMTYTSSCAMMPTSQRWPQLTQMTLAQPVVVGT